MTGSWDGGQAEYVRVPFGEHTCLSATVHTHQPPCASMFRVDNWSNQLAVPALGFAGACGAVGAKLSATLRLESMRGFDDAAASSGCNDSAFGQPLALALPRCFPCRSCVHPQLGACVFDMCQSCLTCLTLLVPSRLCPPLAADLNCLKVPPGLSDDQVVLLSDILPTAWHANEMGEVSKGDRVAIWGAGPGGGRQHASMQCTVFDMPVHASRCQSCSWGSGTDFLHIAVLSPAPVNSSNVLGKACLTPPPELQSACWPHTAPLSAALSG
jgi:hypothetical protein